MSTAFPQTFSRAQIETLIPHRAPILLLDEITDWESDSYIEAKRYLHPEETLFNGHFPGNPLLPGVLIVEAMAQAAAVLISLSKGLNSDNALYLFTGIQEVKLLSTVKPHDTLSLRAEKIRDKLGLFFFSGTAHVGTHLAASATFNAKLIRK